MGVSNNVTAVLNLLSLFCSVPVIFFWIWLSSKPDNECAHHLRWPIVVLGTLLPLVGAYWNKQGWLAVYLFAMALRIAALLFAFVATTIKVSYSFPGREYGEYRLGGRDAACHQQSAEPDCYLWSNDQGRLCYDCISCKAVLLGNLREEWRKANTIVMVDHLHQRIPHCVQHLQERAGGGESDSSSN